MATTPNLKNVMYHFLSSKTSTKSVVLKGYFTKETEFTISDVVKSSAFLTDELNKSTAGKKFQVGNSLLATPTLPLTYHEGMQPFTFVSGSTANETDLKTWAVRNGYLLFKDGVEIVGPVLIDISINAAKTVVTFTFNKNINNNLADNPAIKAAVTLATSSGINGTFNALGGSDTVSTPAGSAATFTVTLNAALTGTGNAIKIAAGTFKDAGSLVNDAIQFNIDITVSTTTFYPVGGATSISRSIDNIKILFDEPQYVVATHLPLTAADITAANVIFKLTNSGGADVPRTVTVAPDGKSINITAVTYPLTGTQAYYVAITAWLEDEIQNATAAANATWTTIA